MVLSYWFATFAFPYRQPIIIDAMRPEISILHVNKDGTRFHESRISVYRDGTYYLTKSERRLFSYTFKEVSYHGIMTSDLRNQLTAIKAIPALQRTLSKAPGSLRAWHGEGWYTEANSIAITAFTTENTTEAPSELAAFFHQIEGIPTTTGVSYEVKDVCLGFCYDPKAGLGYRAENQRCSEKSGGRLVCY